MSNQGYGRQVRKRKTEMQGLQVEEDVIFLLNGLNPFIGSKNIIIKWRPLSLDVQEQDCVYAQQHIPFLSRSYSLQNYAQLTLTV